ncbi:POC1 centriolar protein homolog A isoform X1 [Chelonus insularis]|uniref:POC1 centriolar protein homolog A isoform X1 n=2 Tax=Chelonus insularis TaxID=460826 RepID=UPI00158EC5C4|nr:POC1 centriolar protein homolog A isoform X1 [Chelonus insularis]
MLKNFTIRRVYMNNEIIKNVINMSHNDTDPTIHKNFVGHKEAITSVIFHPNDSKVATSSLDKTFILYNFSESKRAQRFVAHTDAICDIAYAPSGELIGTASKDKTVRLWIPTANGQSVSFKAHMGAVRSIEFSCNGEQLLTASDDKNIKLWVVKQRRFLKSFVGHTNWVRCARFSSDNRFFISCSDDKTIKVWDVSSGKCVKTIHELKDPALDVQLNPSGLAIGSANAGGCVKIYDIRTGTLHQYYEVSSAPINKIRYHPNENFMLTATDESKMKILDILEGRPIYTIKCHEDGVSAIAFSASGEYFASGGKDKQLIIWKSNFDKCDFRIVQNQQRLNMKYNVNNKTEKLFSMQEFKLFDQQKAKELSTLLKANSNFCLNLSQTSLIEVLADQMESFRDTIVLFEKRLSNIENVKKLIK